jgi:hypothetical protein
MVDLARYGMAAKAGAFRKLATLLATVVYLKAKSIYWRAGEVVICGKGSRIERLPPCRLVRAWRRVRGCRRVRPSAVPISADVTVWRGAHRANCGS